MTYRFFYVFNGFLCELPDNSWSVSKGRGCIVITNGEGFILFRSKERTSVKEMASLILVERLGVSKILGLVLADPVVREKSGVLEVVSIDPSHYYWFMSGDYTLQSFILAFNPIPYESITRVFSSGEMSYALTFAAPLGRLKEYLGLFNKILDSIGFTKRVFKYRSVDLFSEGFKAYSIDIPVDWKIDYFISLSSSPSIFKANVFNS